MKTICLNPNCRFDASQFEAIIEFDNQFRSLYCPVCQTRISTLDELPKKGIFYDEKEGGFFKWIPSHPQGMATEINEIIIINRLTLNIRAKTFEYSEIFYRYALVFLQNGQILQNQLFAPPDNYYRYGIKILSAKLTSKNDHLELRFELVGGYTGTVVISAFVTETSAGASATIQTGSALKVWPNFKRPAWKDLNGAEYLGWNDYFIYFASSDTSIKTEWLRVVGEKPELIKKFDGSTPKGMVDFAPEVIEICANGSKDGTIFKKYYCSFRVGLNTLTINVAANNEPIRLAIDFGTSNTCFAYSKPGLHQGLWEDPRILKISDKSHTLIDGLQLESDLEHTWFPSLQEQELLPSELVFPNEPQLIFGQNNPLTPILHYTIPPLKWRIHEQKRISAGFKWQQATEPSALSNYHQELQKMYLSLVLRLALAELVSRSEFLGGSTTHPNKVNLYITYPLSMSDNEYAKLLKSYEEVIELIKNGTGITLYETAVVDESYAGEIGTIAGDAKHKIFIDVGGGTTDVSAVEVKDMKEIDLQVVDSVRYAGNDFLRVLANDGRPGNISTKPLIELQRRIRMMDQNMLEDPSTFGGKNRQKIALDALNRFTNGLIQYLTRIVALKTSRMEAHDSKERIDIYLLGNGWRFLTFAASTDSEDISDDIAWIRDKVTEQLSKELNNYKNKQVINIIPEFKIHYPNEPKTVVALGALLVNDPPTRKKREPKTFLGCNVKVVSLGQSKLFSWDEIVPLKLEQDANGIFIESALASFEEDKVPDYRYEKPPMKALNEIDIRSETLIGKRIIRNAFNVYLERWYRRHLNPEGWT